MNGFVQDRHNKSAHTKDKAETNVLSPVDRHLEIAELHLHIEGTLEPETVFRLARRNRVELPYPDVESLSRAHQFQDLASFLALYYQCMEVLRDAGDFYDLADAYLARAAANGVVRAEIFFDPQAHLIRGIPIDEVLSGLLAAVTGSLERHSVSVGLIACFLRDRGPAEAMRTLEKLAPYSGSLLGVGLDSAEVGYPPKDFAEVFSAARTMGLRRVAHAGEEGPPEYIWQALDILGAERIDHGIRCMEEQALVERLAADRVPLTVCPLSNVRLRCVDDIRRHPLPAMVEAGLHVTINSDDPAYFGGYIRDNYRAVAEAFELTDDALRLLAVQSLEAAFTQTVNIY